MNFLINLEQKEENSNIQKKGKRKKNIYSKLKRKKYDADI